MPIFPSLNNIHHCSVPAAEFGANIPRLTITRQCGTTHRRFSSRCSTLIARNLRVFVCRTAERRYPDVLSSVVDIEDGPSNSPVVRFCRFDTESSLNGSSSIGNVFRIRCLVALINVRRLPRYA